MKELNFESMEFDDILQMLDEDYENERWYADDELVFRSLCRKESKRYTVKEFIRLPKIVLKNLLDDDVPPVIRTDSFYFLESFAHDKRYLKRIDLVDVQKEYLPESVITLIKEISDYDDNCYFFTVVRNSDGGKVIKVTSL